MPDDLLKAASSSGFWPAMSARARHVSRQLLAPLEREAAGDAGVRLRTRRDQLLARQLSRAFERDLEQTALEGVQFYVRGGVVTLYGTVAHALDRRLVVDLVRSAPGVEGVVAHLQVVGHAALPRSGPPLRPR